jgi:uncharacterized membrane protein YhfC
MLAVSVITAVATMIALPFALATAILRRLGMPLRLLIAGAATFAFAQLLRVPLLQAMTHGFASGTLPSPDPAYVAAFNILVLSLTAGLFEEGARFLAYRYVIPDTRSWNGAVTFGAGHGGCESAMLGALMGLELANMVALGSPPALPGLTPDEQTRIAAAVAQYWATPAYVPMLGALERVFSIVFHMAMAVMVLRALTRRNLGWLAAAVALHATGNAIAALILHAWGPLAAETAVGIFAAAALTYLVWERRRDTLAPR